MQEQHKRDGEEECTNIFILVHLNIGLHPILTLQDDIFTNTISLQLDQQPLDFTTIGFHNQWKIP